ncbi:hypothetical protein C8R47DRAFT_1135803 [Mycena vitilis]|nr:hypothetical protein C8R47DRAFT_1135803 [Mycena vitilis]
MALMINLSHAAAAFELHDLNGTQLQCPLHLGPIRSTISSLAFLIDGYKQDSQVLAEIMGCLTLPHLRELHISTTCHFNVPLTWPLQQFGSLSSRSAFHDSDTLCALDISGACPFPGVFGLPGAPDHRGSATKEYIRRSGADSAHELPPSASRLSRRHG